MNKTNTFYCMARLMLLLLISTSALNISAQTQSEQFGYARIDFRITEDEQSARGFVIFPKDPATDGSRPWIWYAPTFIGGHPHPVHRWMYEKLLAKGFYICGVDVGESFGSPAGRKIYSDFYFSVTKKYGLDAKASLLAQSRGGLMLYNWAVENTDKVKCIAGIYPVCDIESYPGLKNACNAYGMTEKQLLIELNKHNPIDRLENLAKANIPILHIHGDSDGTVPLNENSKKLIQRYNTLGGNAEVIIVKGKGHEVCPEFFQNEKFLEFLLGDQQAVETK